MVQKLHTFGLLNNAFRPTEEIRVLRTYLTLGAKFRRLCSKLGAPKAITAMAHTLARLIYRMLKFGRQ
jgi:transposase